MMEYIKRWGFLTGLTIVVGTHVYMAVYGLPESQVIWHWVTNIIAGILIYFGDKKTLF